MNPKDTALYHDLIEKTRPLGVPDRYALKAIRRLLECSEGGPQGETAVIARDSKSYQAIVELLTAGARFLYLQEASRIEEQRLQLLMDIFRTQVLEEFNFDEHATLYFYPTADGGIIRRGLNEHIKDADSPSSHQRAVNEYCELISLALESPLAAGTMAQDPRLPAFLQQFGRVLIAPNFAPRLRTIIEECLEKPASAREFRRVAAELNMPAWFQELLAVLSARKDFAKFSSVNRS